MSTEDRMRILQMIEDGQISAAEGLQLLTALPAEEPTVIPPPPPRPRPTPSPTPPEFSYWRNWWLIPFGIGVGIVVLGASLMAWAYNASGGLSFWFACAAFPFTIGVIVMALAAASRASKWIHIRIKSQKGKGPRNLALSFPLPVRPVAWFIRTFGQQIPALQRTAVDEMLLALDESATGDNPVYVDVHDEDDGEHVQVYIG